MDLLLEMVCQCLKCAKHFQKRSKCTACLGGPTKKGHSPHCTGGFLPAKNEFKKRVGEWEEFNRLLAHGMAFEKAKESVREQRLLQEAREKQKAALEKAKKRKEKEEQEQAFMERMTKKIHAEQEQATEEFFQETSFQFQALQDNALQQGSEGVLRFTFGGGTHQTGGAVSSSSPPPLIINIPPTPRPALPAERKPAEPLPAGPLPAELVIPPSCAALPVMVGTPASPGSPATPARSRTTRVASASPGTPGTPGTPGLAGTHQQQGPEGTWDTPPAGLGTQFQFAHARFRCPDCGLRRVCWECFSMMKGYF